MKLLNFTVWVLTVLLFSKLANASNNKKYRYREDRDGTDSQIQDDLLKGNGANVIDIGAKPDQTMGENLINAEGAEPDQMIAQDHRSFISNGECHLAKDISIPYSDITTNYGKGLFDMEDCGVFEDGHHHAFYTLTVAAPTFVTATTCSGWTSFDTQISVLTGDCENLVCLDGNEDDEECVNDDHYSRVNFNAVPGETYTITVHGEDDKVGRFELIVESVPPPPNDECSGAISLTLDAWELGSTRFASLGSYEECVVHMTDGIWYTFSPPTDGAYYATVCDPLTDVDTMISVFKGSCAALECVDGNDQNGDCDEDNNYSHVAWDAVTTEAYFIYVHGYSELGTFNLKVSAATPPTADDCTNAILLSLDAVVAHDNIHSIRDPTLQDCDITPNAGTWFKYTADTDSTLRVTTANGTDFEAQIVVFKGVCASLECIGGNAVDVCYICYDYDDYHMASYTWDATNGVTYYFQVSGKEGDRGNFDILVEDVIPPDNDDCDTAAVFTIGEFVDQHISSATDDGSTDCYDVKTYSGVWYQVTPPLDTVLIASTCSYYTMFDTQITVYDSCGGNCVGANDDAEPYCDEWYALSEVTWEATGGTTYYILTHGFMGDRGGFELRITEDCHEDRVYMRHEYGKWVRYVLHNEHNVPDMGVCCTLCLHMRRCEAWAYELTKLKCKLHGYGVIPKDDQEHYEDWVRMRMAVTMD